ncbi:MAG: hypothetical protein H6Q00_2048 [Holophagaceae bacterium]|nr:hypothetical protein [Holophagaceae bacterium]
MIRRYLVAGLITLLPLAVTLWVLQMIFNALVGIFQGPFSWVALRMGLPVLPYWTVAALSILGILVILFLVGVLVGNLLGRQLLQWMDDLMLRVPVVKGVYGATKQLMSAIQQGKGGSFREVVVVEWPMAGSYTLGMVARTDCRWALPEGETMVAVYIPTAPNPTSGYVIMVDRSRVRKVDLSPDQVLTWAVSAGVVVPNSGGTDAGRG